jgi:hypothetical protein
MSSDRKPKGYEYLKYSGLAFQMFFTILLGWFIGSKIDGWLGLSKPVFALTLLMLFLAGFFYKLVKDLSEKP